MFLFLDLYFKEITDKNRQVSLTKAKCIRLKYYDLFPQKLSTQPQ